MKHFFFLVLLIPLLLLSTSCNTSEAGSEETPLNQIGGNIPPTSESASENPAEQLQVTQRETMQLLNELDLFCDISINIQKNQVEVYVTDSKLFHETLQRAGAQLPANVVTIVTYEPLYKISFEVNPDPSIHFPQLKMRSGTFMALKKEGELILQDGYLHIGESLIIWQPDFFLNNNSGSTEILDRNGQVLLRVGDEVVMGGGYIESLEYINRLIKEPLSQECEGPYWLMSEIISKAP